MLVFVRLSVPFPLFLPNDEWWSLGTSERPVKIKVSRRMGSWYFAFDEANLTWIDPTLTELLSEKGKVSRDSKHIWLGVDVKRGERKETARRVGAYRQRTDAFLIGLHDRQPYTTLVVVFETDHKDKEELSAATDDLVEMAFEHVRLFISTYRLVTNDHQSRDPRPSDSPLMEIGYTEENQNAPAVTEPNFQHLTYQIRPRPSVVANLFDDEIPSEQMKMLGKRLRQEMSVPLHLQLLLDARERATHDEDPRMGVVLVVSAFETFLQQRLLEECEVRGVVKLESGREWRPFRKAIEQGALIQDLLDSYARDLIGESVKSDSTYQKWRAEAYECRRQIIHRGRRNVSKDQFVAAFDATVAYMNHLNALFLNTRP